jgi:hypothetical protein
MSNLRDLIAYADNTTFQQVVGLTTASIGSKYKQIRFMSHCAVNHQTHYSAIRWKAPVNTSFIKFEIWGQGGSGGGSCCCMWGGPGGGGAYAFKIICAKEYGDLSGCPYELCIATGSCCRPEGNQFGQQGCKSYIVGHGLCNFCAEGGHGGITKCALNNGCCFCWGNNWSPASSCLDRADSAGQWMMGKTYGCEFFCGPHYMQCGHSCFTPGGGIGQRQTFLMDGLPEISVYGNLFGNKGDRYDSCCVEVFLGHPVNHCYGGACFVSIPYCAPYYGADGGAHGLPGMITSPYNQDAAQWCMVVDLHPYPGGLINTRGGWVAIPRWDMNNSGYQSLHSYSKSMMGVMAGGEGSDDAHNHYIPGLGGKSSSSTGGNCYCGGPGGNGMIQITYG